MIIRNKPLHGFTLIELLVVIAIIALLIAILLPALSRAKEQGRRTICRNNIRQLVIGMHAYGNDFNDRLPYHIAADPSKPATQEGFAPYKTYALRYQTPEVAFYGMGLLIEGRYVTEPMTFYCPSMINPLWQYDTPENPWIGRSSFNYRGGLIDIRQLPDLSFGRSDRLALLADMWTLDQLNDPSYVDLFSHLDGYNVGFLDGHVTYLLTHDPILTGADPVLIIQNWRDVFDEAY